MHDWDDLRTVLAIARAGSLSGAARALRLAQPTVGRRLERFEKSLGARLFERRAQGLIATAAGERLRLHAERMEHEAIAAERALSGRDAGVRGSVRITASEWVAARVIAPLLAPLLERNRELIVELVADPRHLNLGRGEADLALRPSKFEGKDVYARAVAELGFGLYASPDYLSRRGAPDAESFASGGAGHELITMADDVGDACRAWITAHCGRARVVARCNGREAMAQLASSGAGLACLPRVVGDGASGLRLLRTPTPIPSRQLWLGAHRAARSLPRVRAVSRYLAEELATRTPALAGC